MFHVKRFEFQKKAKNNKKTRNKMMNRTKMRENEVRKIKKHK